MKLTCPLCKNKPHYTTEGLKAHLARFHQRVKDDKALKKCVHYWVIDIENMGICKYCGAVKQFPKMHEIDYLHGANLIVKGTNR